MTVTFLIDLSLGAERRQGEEKEVKGEPVHEGNAKGPEPFGGFPLL